MYAGHGLIIYSVFSGSPAVVRFQLPAGVNTMKEEVLSLVGVHILEAPRLEAQLQVVGHIQQVADIREAVGSKPRLANTGGHKDQDGSPAGKRMALRTRSAQAR
jgi:hypothetical protein